MKTLLLMRHGKATQDRPVADHDRPLTNRGHDDAEYMGRWLVRQRLQPDRIISSTALRAYETAMEIATACKYRQPIETQPSLYLAPAAAYLAVLRALPGNPDTVLLVGHNPGLTELVCQLSGEDQEMRTSALAHFTWPIPNWSELDGGLPKLKSVQTPDSP
jgi:phosphohistidine phosphatase